MTPTCLLDSVPRQRRLLGNTKPNNIAVQYMNSFSAPEDTYHFLHTFSHFAVPRLSLR